MENQLKEQLLRDEGEVLHAYADSLGYLTIGIGRLIDNRKGGGITHGEALYLLDNDIYRTVQEIERELPWTSKLDDARKGVLVNMAFQMGLNGLLGFRNTLAMVREGRYARAAENMLYSKWASQTPGRARRLSLQMASGVWQ